VRHSHRGTIAVGTPAVPGAVLCGWDIHLTVGRARPLDVVPTGRRSGNRLDQSGAAARAAATASSRELTHIGHR
jgi:hypothetical protein